MNEVLLGARIKLQMKLYGRSFFMISKPEICLNNEHINIGINYQILSYLRTHQTRNGYDDWYDITITRNDIPTLMSLANTEDEIKFISRLKHGDIIDIIEHTYF